MVYKSVKKILLIFLLPFFGDFVVLDKNENITEWEIAKDKDGIKVYARQAEGEKIKEFKAVMKVKTTLNKIEQIIDNINSYASWQANVTTSKSLLEEGNTEQYIYYTSELPWPVDDRDIVLHSVKTKNDNLLKYELSASPNYTDKNDDFLRITNSKGSWIFTSNNTDKMVVVTYQFFGDPGGNMPNWLINMFIVDGPFETLKNLRKKLE